MEIEERGGTCVLHSTYTRRDHRVLGVYGSPLRVSNFNHIVPALFVLQLSPLGGRS
jgi:hypothetical protein